MIGIIDSYMRNVTKDDVRNLAIKNNISLSNEELDFTYAFVKENYKQIVSNPRGFNFSEYASHYTPENFEKIKSLISKYSSYL